MLIKRYHEKLDDLMTPGKALLIMGPRRVGKTTVLKQFLAQTSLKFRLESGDNIRVQQVLSSKDFRTILEFVEGYDLLALDEAQQIQEIGAGLKIIVDNRPDMRVIATGSSSFDLAHQTGEPLTGRKRTITLFPIAQLEMLAHVNRQELSEKLHDFLIYGSYPEVVVERKRTERINVLNELVNSYLLKDILAFEKVRGSRTLHDLLKLLAFQVGSEVSLSELATQVKRDVKTVARHLDILEKSFVIVSVGGYSRNLCKEITSKQKYYFLDNGVRNALLAQFNDLSLRNDHGQLWENFVVSERMKKRAYTGVLGMLYFWRTYDQKEIDIVEDRDGGLFAYECKWATDRIVKPPTDWVSAYPSASFSVVTPANYLDFIA